MKRLLLFLLLVFFLTVDDSSGSWGRGGCAAQGPVGPPAYFMTPAEYTNPAYHEWQWYPWAGYDGGKWWKLKKGTTTYGAFHPEHGYWKILSENPQTWDEAESPCPTMPPIARAAKELTTAKAKTSYEPMGPEEEIINFGMSWDKHTGGITHQGKAITFGEAANIIEQSNLSDDTLKPRMVVVGSADEQKKVKDAIAGNPALKKLTDQFTAHYAAPGWFATRKYPQDQHPYVGFWLPKKDTKGKTASPLTETDPAKGITELPALAQEAVNKLDPNWHPPTPPGPNPAPGPGPIIPPVAPDLSQIPAPMWVLIGSAAVVALLIMNQRKQ